MKNRVVMALVGSALLAFVFFFLPTHQQKPSEAATTSPRTIHGVERPLYKEGELLVKMKPGLRPDALRRANASVGATSIRNVGFGTNLVKLPAGMSVLEGIALYRQNQDVLETSPNYYRYAAQTFPDDPFFQQGFQWDMFNTGQNPGSTAGADIKATQAWGLTTGDHNLIIAIVDSGIDIYHPDLEANLWVNPIDGSHGINAKGGVVTNLPIDDFGHGTHVAGTVGAVGNNSVGIAGVNWNVQLMACKFLHPDPEFPGVASGTVGDELICLDFIQTQAQDFNQPIVAVNASYGGLMPVFTFEASAIDSLRQSGILFVAAAGNAAVDNDGLFNFPSSYDLPNIIAVTATDDTDRMASFASFGRRTVHVGAPGVNIFSTLPVDMGSYGPTTEEQGFSGTSMGTPHVTGTTGLLYSLFGLSPVTGWPLVRNRILTGGDLDPFLVGKTMTGRRLNAFGALTCSNTELLARVRPATSEFYPFLTPDGTLFFFVVTGRNSITTMFGQTTRGNFFSEKVKLSALHARCENPAGNVTVHVGDRAITLLDDGQPPFDVFAGDGVYSASWQTPRVETDLTATFPNVGTSSGSFQDSFGIHVRRTNDPNGFVVAVAGPGPSAHTGDNVELNGTLSSGELEPFTPLFFNWTQTSGPPVTFGNHTATDGTIIPSNVTPFPFFVAPEVVVEPGQEEKMTLTFELAVNDLDGNVATDTVSMEVTPAPTEGGGGGGGGSPCFIATAAYGSGDAHSVVVLRQFRDQYLLTNAPGRAFARAYYQYSPSAASFIAERPALRQAVRIGLLPAVVFASFMLATTTLQKLLVVTVLALMIISFVTLIKRNRRWALQQSEVE